MNNVFYVFGENKDSSDFIIIIIMFVKYDHSHTAAAEGSHFAHCCW
jgi:hypothetical protein